MSVHSLVFWQPIILPLDQLLNCPTTSINTASSAGSSLDSPRVSRRHNSSDVDGDDTLVSSGAASQIAGLRMALNNQQRRVEHLSELLNESEANVARLEEQAKVSWPTSVFSCACMIAYACEPLDFSPSLLISCDPGAISLFNSYLIRRHARHLKWEYRAILCPFTIPVFHPVRVCPNLLNALCLMSNDELIDDGSGVQTQNLSSTESHNDYRLTIVRLPLPAEFTEGLKFYWMPKGLIRRSGTGNTNLALIFTSRIGFRL